MDNTVCKFLNKHIETMVGSVENCREYHRKNKQNLDSFIKRKKEYEETLNSIDILLPLTEDDYIYNSLENIRLWCKMRISDLKVDINQAEKVFINSSTTLADAENNLAKWFDLRNRYKDSIGAIHQ